MSSVHWLDIAVLVVYLTVVVGWGCWFALKTSSADQFMSAGRAMPGWVVGLSIFGSYVSSISFLANPGKSYMGNWNPLMFALSIPLAAWISVRWFVPFYRNSGEVSAYTHLEHRFGPWARTYGVVCYLLLQLGRLGMILYLLALALNPMVGLDVVTLIVISGFVVTIYPFFGGSEGVIWTGAVQALVLIAGVAACVIALCLQTPGGTQQIFSLAVADDKFSLGSLGPSLAISTVWVVFMNGIFSNLQNFGIDQSYVQRYVGARSDSAAGHSLWMGAMAYIPLNMAFLFIGTALFAFYHGRTDMLPESVMGPDGKVLGDKVFPFFISTELPAGMTGLVIAAICSAAMDSNLNCCATLYLCDIHRRYLRPEASEFESMWALRITTLVMGALSTGAALAMIGTKSALDLWWDLTGILSGGILGVFLLGMLSRRPNSRAAAVGTVLGVAVILWMTISLRPIELPEWVVVQTSLPSKIELPEQWRSPFHGFMIIVVGTVVVVGTGFALSVLSPFRNPVWGDEAVPERLAPESIAPSSQEV